MTETTLESPLTFHADEMPGPAVHPLLGGRVGVYSARCPGKQTANEDAAAIVPIGDYAGVLVVADGMGGHAAGEVAARTAIREMIRAVEEVRGGSDLLRTAIINGFERANQQVQALATGAGTTLAAVELADGCARPYHAGDSIVLIVGSRGKIKLETTSHSPVGFGVEAGLLDATEAMSHEHRHLVLNAIGSDTMRIEIGSAVKLSKRDTVLLASDGLTDNLTVDEIVQRVRKGPLESAMERLVSECNQRMSGRQDPSKPDDLTVAVFRPS